MRKLLGILTAMTGMTLAGCQLVQAPRPEVSTGSVLDVKPVGKEPVRFAQPVQIATPPEEPAVAISNDPPVSVTPTVGFTHAGTRKTATSHALQASDQASYRVKKGDTLYRIARTEYGDGKKWTLIASANPGLSPQSLKTGQTIVIP